MWFEWGLDNFMEETVKSYFACPIVTLLAIASIYWIKLNIGLIWYISFNQMIMVILVYILVYL